MKKLFGLFLTFFLVAMPTAAADEDQEGPFVISDNVMMDVERGLEAALNNNELALIVIGANWCHDTRSLTDKFDDPALKAALEGYTVTLVNANQFDEAEKVVNHFDHVSLYYTPTILIVDPKTGKQVNTEGMYVWRDAYAIPVAEKAAYFTAMKDKANQSPANYAFTMKRYYNNLLVDIRRWEATQMKRVTPIYKQFILWVDLEKAERPDGFDQKWADLWGLRQAITDDVEKLKADAWARVNAGEHNIELDFPTYQKFDWEDALFNPMPEACDE